MYCNLLSMYIFVPKVRYKIFRIIYLPHSIPPPNIGQVRCQFYYFHLIIITSFVIIINCFLLAITITIIIASTTIYVRIYYYYYPIFSLSPFVSIPSNFQLFEGLYWVIIDYLRVSLFLHMFFPRESKYMCGIIFFGHLNWIVRHLILELKSNVLRITDNT